MGNIFTNCSSTFLLSFDQVKRVGRKYIVTLVSSINYSMNKKKHRGLTVLVGDNINIALRKFKSKVEDSKVLIDVINRQEYEKPTTERKRKKSAAKSRWLKKLAGESLPKKNY